MEEVEVDEKDRNSIAFVFPLLEISYLGLDLLRARQLREKVVDGRRLGHFLNRKKRKKREDGSEQVIFYRSSPRASSNAV